MPGNVLMIAYHFPPFAGSSGIQRTLNFVRYLPAYGWQPIVLAPHPRAYPHRSGDLLEQVPLGVPVRRAFALDVARHLAVRGVYLKWMALPDRYSAWLLGAIPAGLDLHRRHRLRVIWSTYPVATAHLIGYALGRLTGLPWIAEFRDPMLYEAWPEDPLGRRVHGWLERLTVKHASHIVCVTPSAVAMYRRRYPEQSPEKFSLISNGFDEANFAVLSRRRPSHQTQHVTLIHSGLLEPADRDPEAFFSALSDLKREGFVEAGKLRVILRGSGFDARYRVRVQHWNIADIVALEPFIPYQEALQEMLDADGLLLFQGPSCNLQVPAKLYEYLRAATPIYAIADPDGDTWRVLAEAGISTRAPFGNRQQIALGLREFLDLLQEGHAPLASNEQVSRYERRALTGALARVLNLYNSPAGAQSRTVSGAGTRTTLAVDRTPTGRGKDLDYPEMGRDLHR